MNNTTIMPPVMILCGGRGTRIREVTELLPKPMVPIGEQPIVWHVMKSYAAFGVKRFILCLGYKRDSFVDYFMNYRTRISDVTITLGECPEVNVYGQNNESDWEVTLAGTGVDAMTGARVFRAAKYLRDDDENFFLTYGDGVADVNIAELYARHLDAEKLLTITAVHPVARFGELILNGNEVNGFEEKPAKSAGFINGGFMAINRKFINKYLSDNDALMFEQFPMQQAVHDKTIQVFKHEGFWQCMDNPREHELLETLWRTGRAPWKKYWK